MKRFHCIILIIVSSSVVLLGKVAVIKSMIDSIQQNINQSENTLGAALKTEIANDTITQVRNDPNAGLALSHIAAPGLYRLINLISNRSGYISLQELDSAVLHFNKKSPRAIIDEYQRASIAIHLLRNIAPLSATAIADIITELIEQLIAINLETPQFIAKNRTAIATGFLYLLNILEGNTTFENARLESPLRNLTNKLESYKSRTKAAKQQLLMDFIQQIHTSTKKV